MGYSTEFKGAFKLNKPLDRAHENYLKDFARTRRMKRNVQLTNLREDTLRQTVGLPLGIEGEFFVGEGDFGGQGHGPDITNYNEPPSTQPSLWNHWVPTPDGQGIHWDGGEKFSGYVKWLKYLIGNFLVQWGYVLNGEVEYQGDDPADFGKIVVTKNQVSLLEGKRTY